MYKDVNNKTGYRGLQGTSGKRYGNLKLFSPEEIAEVLADGITEVAPVVQPAIPPEIIEQRRIDTISSEAQKQIFSRLTEDVNFYSAIIKELNMIQEAVVLLNAAVDTTGLPAEDQTRLAELLANANLVNAIRALAATAKAGTDTPTEFRYAVEQAHGGKCPNDDWPLGYTDGELVEIIT